MSYSSASATTPLGVTTPTASTSAVQTTSLFEPLVPVVNIITEIRLQALINMVVIVRKVIPIRGLNPLTQFGLRAGDLTQFSSEEPLKSGTVVVDVIGEVVHMPTYFVLLLDRIVAPVSCGLQCCPQLRLALLQAVRLFKRGVKDAVSPGQSLLDEGTYCAEQLFSGISHPEGAP